MILNIDQANQIKADFSYLVGKPYFEDSTKCFVDDVVIAPYDAVNREIFLKNYSIFGSDDEALQGYPISFYTVLLISDLDPDMLYEEIFNYAKHSSIQIDYLKYGIEPPKG